VKKVAPIHIAEKKVQAVQALVSADEIANVEAVALEQVKAAEQAGEKKGLEEATRLISKMKDNAKINKTGDDEVALLQAKFKSTSTQVSNIINNFSKVHNDLQ